MIHHPESLSVVNDEAMSSSIPQRTIGRELGAVATAFVASRLLVFGTIFLSRLEIIRGPLWQPGSWFEALAHGDGIGYVNCAQNLRSIGTCYPDPTISFFPVYPSVVAFVGIVLRDVALAAVVVSHVCLFAAGWLLYRVVRTELGDHEVGRASVMLLMFSPGALFFSTATADSMLLLLAIGSLAAARAARWPLAALLAAIAAATMNIGLLLLVPLAIELALQIRARRRDQRSFAWASALPLAIIPGELAVAMLVGNFRFGNPAELLRISADTQTTFARLVNISSTFASYAAFWKWIFAGSVVVAAGLGVSAWTKLRASHAAYATVVVGACVIARDWEAPRTLALAFPLFVALAVVVRKLEWTYEAILLVCGGLLALFTILSANGHWLT